MRPIDADALINLLKECQKLDWENNIAPMSWNHAFNNFIEIIDGEPTIEVEAVEPMKIEDVFGPHTWVCGYCYNMVGTKLFKNLYCSHCGRKVKWNEAEE